MPYVVIPRDITKVKSKIAFGMTKRQLICAACGAVVGLPAFWFSRKLIGDDFAFYLMFFLVAPFGLMAFYEKNGMPFEKYIVVIFRWLYLRPRVRGYEIDNIWDAVNRQASIEKEIQIYVVQNEEAKRAAKGKKKPIKGENRSGQKAHQDPAKKIGTKN